MTIQPYGQGDSDDLVPLNVLGQMIRHMQTQSRDIAEIKDQVARLEPVMENRDWVTLRGFVVRYNVQIPERSDPYLSQLGAKIAQWHSALNLHYRRGGSFHTSYGKVNQYNCKHLAKYFRDTGTRFDETAFGEDFG